MADARLAGTRVIQVLIEGDKPDTIKQPDVLRRMDQLGRSSRISRCPSARSCRSSICCADEPRHRPRGGGKLPDTDQGVRQYLLLYAMGGDGRGPGALRRSTTSRTRGVTAYIKTDDFRAMKR
jgi:hypothetical protein